MAESLTLTPVTDRSPFSLHPEDWVTQHDSHDEQGAYLKYGLRLHLPDCFVARDLAVYWVPGETQHPYVGPDLFVARGQSREEDPSVWLTYEDGPLALVIEIASEGTRHLEKKRRDETYARVLQVPEYVSIDRKLGDLRLGRLVNGRYEWIAPDEAGRWRSDQFGVAFVWGEGERFVRLVGADGQIVPTQREAAVLREVAAEQALREARRAEQEAQRAVRAVRRAEREAARAEQEAVRAQQEAARAEREAARAEQEAAHAEREAARAEREAARAERETHQRAAAEQRAQALEAEVERLRRLVDGGASGDDPR